MEFYHCLLSLVALSYVKAGPATENYKDQFCTDPRTMRKHAAYTEWADAYSCTRHRCQPGGRNLAIYTVGCKRVEAPESAIECEEVVEDTNMQFPYCCTRLRCLVVVRGEVWTRVLGQPWETLPAAPWSHMYKMKKPPPGDTSFLPKSPGEGPIYELQQAEADKEGEKVLRSGKKSTSDAEPVDEPKAGPEPHPTPDIVIALSTNVDNKERPNKKMIKDDDIGRSLSHEVHRNKRGRKDNNNSNNNFFEEDQQIEPRVQEPEPEEPVVTEKVMEPQSDEKYYANAYGVTQRVPKTFQSSHGQQVPWTEAPQPQWNEHEKENPPEPENKEHEQPEHPEHREHREHHEHHQPEYPPEEPPKKEKELEEKPANLQALVDAIGTRMRDIESVVQRMSEKVQQKKPSEEGSAEKNEKKPEPEAPEGHKHQPRERERERERDRDRESKVKKPNPDGEHYKRFHSLGSKYIHGSADITTEKPLFVEDSNLNGYFSDASNTVRRASPPKEPAATYMAPVENRRKMPPPHAFAENSEEVETRRRKKHSHKKKKTKGGHHKKHHEKRKRFNRLNSVELDKNTVSLEDNAETRK